MDNLGKHLTGAVAVLLLLSSGMPLHGQEPDAATPPPSTATAPAITNAAPTALEHDSTSFGRLTLGASYGDDLSVYAAEALCPLLEAERYALYFNPRGLLLEDEDQELNLGLVMRRLSADENCILGLNFYYDARFTDADNTLQQVGGGLEMLSRRFDARANYYYPVSDEKSLGGGVCPFTGAAVSCRGMEEAMEGFDFEAGVWLPFIDRYLPAGIFAGYYRFESDVTSDKVDGLKVRLEIRPCQNVTLDAAWFDDSGYRDSEYIVGVRFHLPLDFWKGVKMDRAGGRLPAFPARMTDPVQRDFRVRTLITRPALPAARPSAKAKTKPTPAPVCRTYPALDENGDVIFVTVCE